MFPASCKLQTVSLLLKATAETLHPGAHASLDASPVMFKPSCILLRPREGLQRQTDRRRSFPQTLVFLRPLSAERLELHLDSFHIRKRRITALRPNCQEESVIHGGVHVQPALNLSVPLKLGGASLHSYCRDTARSYTSQLLPSVSAWNIPLPLSLKVKPHQGLSH